MVVVDVPEIPLALTLAYRRITVRVTRDGLPTSNVKEVKFLNANLQLVLPFALLDGANASYLFLASAVDGTYLALVLDEVLPRRAAASYPTISEDVTLAFDLNDGQGGGGGGEQASLHARVRVNGAGAAREVVAVERQVDGAWRIAGNAQADELGEAELDLRVNPNALVFALAVDEWGRQFEANLSVAVGMVIRPTVFQGWLYRVTEAGTLPAEEPVWWNDTEAAPQPLGTARAEVIRYYRPLAHGPVPVEVP